MAWWIFALLSGTGLAFRNVFYKLAADKIDAAFAAMVLSVTMATVAISYFIYNRLSEQQPIISDINLKGIGFALIAGVSLAAANIFLGYSYKAGGMASVVGVLQNGFAISLTLLIGITLLGEDIKPIQIAGIVTAAAGIFMIIKA